MWLLQLTNDTFKNSKPQEGGAILPGFPFPFLLVKAAIWSNDVIL